MRGSGRRRVSSGAAAANGEKRREGCVGLSRAVRDERCVRGFLSLPTCISLSCLPHRVLWIAASSTAEIPAGPRRKLSLPSLRGTALWSGD